jgi:hypothetical protein
MLLATCLVHAVSHLLGACFWRTASCRRWCSWCTGKYNGVHCALRTSERMCVCSRSDAYRARVRIISIRVRVRSPNGNPRAQVRAYSGSLRGRV